MISLFHIPTHKIDTSKFSNLLHDKIVTEFEENFARFVGARYACSTNSATSAIFLILKFYERFVEPADRVVTIPTLIPPVVCNAILTAGWRIIFKDDIHWIGNAYVMGISKYEVIDSAQQVRRGQYDITDSFHFFSFYPTKPVSSCDGGMIVSNNENYIDILRQMAFNGMSYAENNWDRRHSMIGYKMYLNSIQAYIANENLQQYPEKRDRLREIRQKYNDEFDEQNISDHLYQVLVKDNEDALNEGLKQGIQCGIHYQPAHYNPLFSKPVQFRRSEIASRTLLSLPFHEKLTEQDIDTVIKFVKTQQ